MRYRLEGLSASGKWTEGLPDLQKEFTRLPFGSYCFRAEVYDENGVISSVDLPFRILRPGIFRIRLSLSMRFPG